MILRKGKNMLYQKIGNESLSALGLGAMRLPTDEKTGEIDLAASAEMVDYAMKSGINYYDTAWGYHGGQSELVMGELLKQYPRDSFYLTSKFPGYDLNNIDKVEEIFEKQLEKCQVEYFDYYLFHNVCEMNIDPYLDPKYGVFDYLIKQKQAGRIRHLAFSAHGAYDVVERFLEAYGEEMAFCQLQINWVDWEFQDARRKTELLAKYGIPVWVMEPLRGGKLARVSDKNEAKLRQMRPNETVVGWAFRFIQSLPGVGVTLSGMSNMEQLRQNVEIFSEYKPLNDAEREALLQIARDMLGNTLPCTGCHYCTEHCPQQLDIPTILDLYNEHCFSDGGFIAPMKLSTFPPEKLPSACIGCGSCERVCPQQIKISQAMKDFASRL